eukprot:TRINITY_DN6395_c1_g1_i3.p2 TRINITY_DN6395_c1_g1~~TRINITY_DN6395_c1_g1_i3.p2  ORF type:complete len:226 (+),score=-17.34 TRINITY_DN6395_c1_g1_i3:770-1447(+)
MAFTQKSFLLCPSIKKDLYDTILNTTFHTILSYINCQSHKSVQGDNLEFSCNQQLFQIEIKVIKKKKTQMSQRIRKFPPTSQFTKTSQKLLEIIVLKKGYQWDYARQHNLPFITTSNINNIKKSYLISQQKKLAEKTNSEQTNYYFCQWQNLTFNIRIQCYAPIKRLIIKYFEYAYDKHKDKIKKYEILLNYKIIHKIFFQDYRNILMKIKHNMTQQERTKFQII